MSRVGVIGAGVAGLTCAQRLARAGHEVTVLDKARGPGGRCATRRADEVRFDHGAQYFTARDAAFRGVVAGWAEAGAVAPWKGRLRTRSADGRLSALPDEARWVGAPTMSALGRHLARDLDVRLGTRVGRVERDDGWWLHDGEGGKLGALDALVLAVPAPQAVPLLSELPELAARVERVRLSPCWAAMLRFAGPLPADFDALALDDDPALAWVARNDSKPGREAHGSWTLHASADWSGAHLQADPEEVVEALLERLDALVHGALPEVLHRAAHRWRYALVREPLGSACIWDADARIGVCGDWCIAPRLEAAWQSGAALAHAMV